jgi:hypothetical protein
MERARVRPAGSESAQGPRTGMSRRGGAAYTSLVPRLQAVRSSLLTLVVGALLGYVVAAFATPFAEGIPIIGAGGESSQARGFMVAFLQRDTAMMSRFVPAQGIVSRAQQLQGTQSGEGSWRPLSLTFLGGTSAGGITLQIYAAEVVTSDGQTQFVPFVLTLNRGMVVRMQ